MKRLALFGILLAGCAALPPKVPSPLATATRPWTGDRTKFLEGIILYSEDRWLAANMMNCQPQVPDDAEFSMTVLDTRLPEPELGHGPASQAVCRYHAKDGWLWLGPGDWVQTQGVCSKTCSNARQHCTTDADCPADVMPPVRGMCIVWAAVATRTQYEMESGGGDTGCDSVGLIATMAKAAGFGPPAMVVTSQLCHSDGKHRKCKPLTNEKARHLRMKGLR
jgi:hypothetical protein